MLFGGQNGQIGLSASAAQAQIQEIYPFEEPVAIVCAECGKLEELPLNRALRDENGDIYDIIAGTFLVVGLTEDNFGSLNDELSKKILEYFKTPEGFICINGKLAVIPVSNPEN